MKAIKNPTVDTTVALELERANKAVELALIECVRALVLTVPIKPRAHKALFQRQALAEGHSALKWLEEIRQQRATVTKKEGL